MQNKIVAILICAAVTVLVSVSRAGDTVGTPTWNGGSAAGNTTTAQNEVSEQNLSCILKTAGTMEDDLKKMSNDSNLALTPKYSEQKAEDAAKAYAAAFEKLESTGVAQKLSHNCLMQLLSFSIEESGLDGSNVQKDEPPEKTGNGYIQITGSKNLNDLKSCMGSDSSGLGVGKDIVASAESSALAALCFWSQNYVKNSDNKQICDNSSDTSGMTQMLALMNSGKKDGDCIDRASKKQMACSEAVNEVRRRLSTFQMVDQASVKCGSSK